MKATIRRPDGTTISVDGATAEDVEKLAGGTTNSPHVCAPCLLPHYPFAPAPVPWTLQPFPAIRPYVLPLQPYICDPFPLDTCMGGTGTINATCGEVHVHNAGLSSRAARYAELVSAGAAKARSNASA